MSHEYTISRCTRKCAISGKALEPGESFVSVLLPKGEEILRLDISASQWTGPQPETIGWWRGKMPTPNAKKLRPTPAGVLLDTLSDLVERPGKESLAYLLALLLTRRRLLTEQDHSPSENTEEAPAIWKLVCPADGRQWNVPVAAPPSEMLDALQQELNALLFTEE